MLCELWGTVAYDPNQFVSEMIFNWCRLQVHKKRVDGCIQMGGSFVNTDLGIPLESHNT